MGNSINGQLKIVNFEYLVDYDNHNNPLYQTVARELEEGIKESMAGRDDVVIKVLNLT